MFLFAKFSTFFIARFNLNLGKNIATNQFKDLNSFAMTRKSVHVAMLLDGELEN